MEEMKMGVWFTNDVYVDMTELNIYYNSTHNVKKITDGYQCNLIKAFYNNPNEVIGYDQLVEEIWGESNVNGNGKENLYAPIKKLRNLIGDEENHFIENSRKVGYMLKAPVQKAPPEWIFKTPNSSIDIKNNIYISTRKELDNLDGEYSLKNRMLDASHIIQICYAGTTFLASGRIGRNYEDTWQEYFRSALSGKRIDLVLANPESDQMREMINYKLRPRYSADNVDRTNPFQYNFTRLMVIMNLIKDGVIKDADFNVYLADFALSNAYLQCKFPDDKSDKETIKVDMYIPLFSKYKIDKDGTYYIPDDEWADDDRPSFIVCKNKQPELYAHLSMNIDDILHNCEDNGNQVIKRGVFKDGWEQKFIDYSNGKFTRPFKKDEILKGLL